MHEHNEADRSMHELRLPVYICDAENVSFRSSST